MSNPKADAESKVKGHRRAIREHIEKYRKYPHEDDKKFALKTIQRVQTIIAELRKPYLKNIPAAPEDTWKP